MDFDYTDYTILPPDDVADTNVTLVFIITVLVIFLVSLLFATFILIYKPQLFGMNIYPDPVPQMTDCSCLNVCLPCTSCSCREALNGCCPRMNLKSFNCIKTFCNRPGPDKLNLVCCVV